MRIAFIAACAVVLASCAAPGEGPLEKDAPGVIEAKPIAPQAALAAIHPGQTKAEVAAALGPANIVAFESGWQVWVYRWPAKDDRSARAATEVVVLVDPTGVVRKVRLRPGLKSPG